MKWAAITIATTNPPMASPRTELRRRASRWLLPATLFALTPKCFLCLAAYAGIGAALGLGGPEICGASSGPTCPRIIALALCGLAAGVIALRSRHRHRCQSGKPEHGPF